MDPRKLKILQAIIEKFVETAEPIGSKLIYEEYDLDVSPATIRNEMAVLEDEGYIMQPHTSAGRVPTSLAYRLFVDQMKLNLMLFKKAKNEMESLRLQFDLKRVKEKLYETVAILAHVTQNVSFAMVPDNPRLFYMGLSNVLRKPEFATDPGRATQVVEVLENRFSELLKSIDIRDDQPSFYIGDENAIPEIKSCSLLVQRYRYKGFHGIMGILGATRMDYPYNLAALKSAIELLE
jgi:transcriptional regulator of heat shock response